ncbi:cupin domain-containing protein [Flavobacterium sp. PLA-1-15]|uniref:cupin domain-containing protein n=1 Tax=Flavobacterium sp. PLA-1-15 TaxID=3380533 RepID=UPI003B7916C0
MQRRNFLFTSLLAVPATLLPRFSFTASNKSTKPKQGVFIKANETRFDGISQTMTNDLLRCVVSNKDTDGQLLMGTTMPNALKYKGGPPLHVHEHQEELFFVVAGEFLIQLGEEIFLAKAGDACFVPRGVPHTFANPYENNPGSLMSVHFPGGNEMEGYFKNIAKGNFPKETDADLKDLGPPIDVEVAMKKVNKS